MVDGADISAIVQSYAGADAPQEPHWLGYPYGDFTRNNTVDTDDLYEFAAYWLTDEDNADIDGDSIVNFYEFSLFAANWAQ
jgi:hypothetical protein